MISLLLAVSVTCCAAEQVREGGHFCNEAIDGDRSTIWHTPFGGPPPHWIELRFPEAGIVTDCTFVHRPVGGDNGTPDEVIDGHEGTTYALWPDGPDGTDIIWEFETPRRIEHDDHPLTFYFGRDYEWGPSVALAEINCTFVADQEPTVDPPCDTEFPTPTFGFAYEHEMYPGIVDGFGVYVSHAGSDWRLVHVINCGFAVELGVPVYRCPPLSFALQRYVDFLKPCEMYSVGVAAVGRGDLNHDMLSAIATDDSTWVWAEWWECDVAGGCSPRLADE